MNVEHHATRFRQQSRVLPPVQFETTGQPISIVDGLVSAIVFAFAIAGVSFLFGIDPREIS